MPSEAAVEAPPASRVEPAAIIAPMPEAPKPDNAMAPVSTPTAPAVRTVATTITTPITIVFQKLLLFLDRCGGGAGGNGVACTGVAYPVVAVCHFVGGVGVVLAGCGWDVEALAWMQLAALLARLGVAVGDAVGISQ